MAAFDKQKIQVAIVTPAFADANNGNWQTALRWAQIIESVATVRLIRNWPDTTDAANRDDVMLALHARRSAASIANWHAERGRRGLGVVLTGTDLYRDITYDAAAQRSLAFGNVLAVLQERAPLTLPIEVRNKARVIFQSTTTRKTQPKPSDRLRLVMVGHLRNEKSPETLFAAARMLSEHPGIRIDHIGYALDPALGEAARQTMRDVPNYRWLGGQPRETVRRRIQRAHLLVHTSKMEGGAHVIMEAVTSGTPVLASYVDGNIGMLGPDYSGYFPWGDARALTTLIESCLTGMRLPAGGLLTRLDRQCQERAPLFSPDRERSAVQKLVSELLGAG